MLTFLPQKQPNPWTCFPTAFAMVMGVQVKDVFEFCGHDGSEIIWPTCPSPYSRRGFHLQELTLYAYTEGWAVTAFENNPMLECSIPNDLLMSVGNYEIMLSDLLINKRAVLGGTNHRSNPHVLAWDGTIAWDPATGLQIAHPFVRQFYFIFDLI